MAFLQCVLGRDVNISVSKFQKFVLLFSSPEPATSSSIRKKSIQRLSQMWYLSVAGKKIMIMHRIGRKQQEQHPSSSSVAVTWVMELHFQDC